MPELDPTENIRRQLAELINTEPHERAVLEKVYGRVWSTAELTQEFEVLGFMAPLVGVCNKSDRTLGTMLFQHEPRYYFYFIADSEIG